NCRLPGESVADDELTLSTTDRDHRVDGLDPCLDGAVHALAGDDARGDLLDGQRLGGLQLTLAVDRYAQRVDNATDELLAHRHLQQMPGGAYLVALVQVAVVAEDDRADLVLLEVQGKAEGVVRKLEQLTGHRVLEAVNLGDAVAGGHDPPDIGGYKARVEVLEALLDDLRDFLRADTQFAFSYL